MKEWNAKLCVRHQSVCLSSRVKVNVVLLGHYLPLPNAYAYAYAHALTRLGPSTLDDALYRRVLEQERDTLAVMRASASLGQLSPRQHHAHTCQR